MNISCLSKYYYFYLNNTLHSNYWNHF